MRVPALLILTAMLATAAAAGPPPAVLGRWRTETDAGVVEINRCAEGLCGRLVTSAMIAREPGLADTHNDDPGLRRRTLKGLLLLSGFSGGPVRWKNGRIYNPDDGHSYAAEMKLIASDRLEVKGCALIVFCKSQIWRRID